MYKSIENCWVFLEKWHKIFLLVSMATTAWARELPENVGMGHSFRTHLPCILVNLFICLSVRSWQNLYVTELVESFLREHLPTQFHTFPKLPTVNFCRKVVGLKQRVIPKSQETVTRNIIIQKLLIAAIFRDLPWVDGFQLHVATACWPHRTTPNLKSRSIVVRMRCTFSSRSCTLSPATHNQNTILGSKHLRIGLWTVCGFSGPKSTPYEEKLHTPLEWT